jgi:hypothetical protein
MFGHNTWYHSKPYTQGILHGSTLHEKCISTLNLTLPEHLKSLASLHHDNMIPKARLHLLILGFRRGTRL